MATITKGKITKIKRGFTKKNIKLASKHLNETLIDEHMDAHQEMYEQIYDIKPSNKLDPKHYNKFKIQVMEFCEVNKLGWCESNVIKYVVRHEGKNGLEDLKKAMEYLKCLIYYKETGKFLTPDKIKKIKRSWK